MPGLFLTGHHTNLSIPSHNSGWLIDNSLTGVGLGFDQTPRRVPIGINCFYAFNFFTSKASVEILRRHGSPGTAATDNENKHDCKRHKSE